MESLAIPLAGLAGLTFLVYSFINWAKYLTNWSTSKNAAITQVVTWAAAVAGVFLFAESQWGALDIENVGTLSAMNTASKIVLGLALGSAASVGYDVLGSIDNTRSTATPPLTGSETTGD